MNKSVRNRRSNVLLQVMNIIMILACVTSSRIPRTNFGIRINNESKSCVSTSSSNDVLRKVGGSSDSTRGGASAVAAAGGAAKTMSANKYKILK